MDKKTRLLNACRRVPVDRIPVWFMRQAGRYLPEYREVRGRTPFLTLCRTPRLAAEVSLQPYRRFDLDAVIVFSDILMLPLAMGMDVQFGDGGPRVTEPIRAAAEVARLRPVDPRGLASTLEAIDLIGELAGPAAPIIGFTGGPFTLAVYLVEGKRTANLEHIRRFAAECPDGFARLLEQLGEGIITYATAQAKAGADVLLLMDTYAGFLSPRDYLELLFPLHRSVLAEIKERTGVPTMLYANGADHLLEHLAGTGADVIGIDWRTDLARAANRFGAQVALQGNLDPAALFSVTEDVVEAVRGTLAAAAEAPGYIFNLGHGMLPGTPVEQVAAAVEAVQRLGLRQAAG